MSNQFTKIDPSRSLKKNYPKLAKEWHPKKNDLKPSEISFGSNKIIWWVCPDGHEYDMPIKSRTHSKKPQNCPYCFGQRIGYGNDLKSMYPKIVREWHHIKNDKKPTDYRGHSGQKVWWICSKKHEYEMRIATRTNEKKPQGCPYCVNKKIGYGNDLQSEYPKIAKQWDYKKNKCKPSEVTSGSKTKRWMLCKKNHSFFIAPYDLINNPDRCPYCSNKKAGYGNDFKSNHPSLAKEWNYSKNIKKPNEYLPASNAKVWWTCSKGHDYEMLIQSRTHPRRPQGCPYCSNNKIGYGNDLKSNYPEIAKMWHKTKNKFGPAEVVPLSVKKAWFICKKGHEHYSTIAVKVKGHDCPYCTGNLIGYGNDLKSNFPHLIKYWDFKKNKIKPSEVFPRSSKKVWWICDNGHSYDQVISDRTREDIEIGCRFCRLTPRSREEIYLAFELMKYFKIDLMDQRVRCDREWDVDIKINSKKLIIEYDGSYWHKDLIDKDLKKLKIYKNTVGQ